MQHVRDTLPKSNDLSFQSSKAMACTLVDRSLERLLRQPGKHCSSILLKQVFVFREDYTWGHRTLFQTFALGTTKKLAMTTQLPSVLNKPQKHSIRSTTYILTLSYPIKCITDHTAAYESIFIVSFLMSQM